MSEVTQLNKTYHIIMKRMVETGQAPALYGNSQRTRCVNGGGKKGVA